MESLYSEQEIEKTYEDVGEHIKTKHIITRYSTNTLDIRDVALGGIDLSGIRSVLDIGCGYGFFTEKLKGLLDSRVVVTGLDILESNKGPFLNSVAKAGYKGRFVRGMAEIIKDMEDNAFDLVITSYSLYFFPHLIKEISRVIRPDGLFIALTHSKFSINEVISLMYSAMEKEDISPPETASILRLYIAFSSEDGSSQVEPYFGRVEKVTFKNALIFPLDNIDECISYVKAKQNLLFKELFRDFPEKAEDVIDHIYQEIYSHAQQKGAFKVSKDDAVFRCLKPRKFI
jgi:ubiquinone/menaquinone biosynthesis C-methylase UbiE